MLSTSPSAHEAPAGRGNPRELPMGKKRQEQVQARAVTELTHVFNCTAQLKGKKKIPVALIASLTRSVWKWVKGCPGKGRKTGSR